MTKDWNLPRLLTLCLMAFTVLMSYAFSRPTVEALLTDAHGKESLPRAWLLMSIVAAVSVLGYNAFATGRRPIALYHAVSFASIAILAGLMALLMFDVPYVEYGLFIWKDIYIVFMIEIFWTYANSTYPPDKARWAYGLFLVMGSLGSLVGNLMVAPISEAWGAESVLWFVFPTLLLAWVGATVVDRLVDGAVEMKTKAAPKFGQGLKTIVESRYMLLLLLLIVATQIAITLIDYEYNAALLEAYPDKDIRAGVGGQVYAAIDISALVLQVMTGPILAAVGVSRTLLGIPVLLGVAVGIFVAVPQFLTMAAAKVASKCFDYSLFRATKEILYIPLNPLEKTQGKAIVDILVYRVTKGAVSLFLIGALSLLDTPGIFMILTLAVLVGWITITVFLLREHKGRVAAMDDGQDTPP